ncbi:hypothetical protein AB0M92_29345 [Streptomyces sp. NPDC051582]|uniref:hypothetical protein n=1 Tax=Streptomyces sp. NPDC051582 TaxID=3155167 RepID=UPI0034345930
MTDRARCATQDHIIIEYLVKSGVVEYSAGLKNVLRDCWFGIAVWAIMAIGLSVLVEPLYGVLLIGGLAIISISVFLVRLGFGHSAKCASLNAVAAPFRIPEFF